MSLERTQYDLTTSLNLRQRLVDQKHFNCFDQFVFDKRFW